jgi:ActR/RegA family two-component response regulator
VVESGRIGGLGYGRLAWPRQVETVRVRKQDRLPTAIPCVVKLVTGDEYNAIIDDLSAGGCCIRGEMASPPTDREELFLSFTLPGSSPVSDVRAVVRRVHSAGAATVIGCEFVEGEDAARQDISFYVVTATERSRSGLVESRRALIIDGNESSASALCRALQDLQLETFVASGLVDGFYRMRVISPLAVFIGYEQKELPAVQICRIVKATKGFENTAVLVYGSDSMAVHDEALEAGADAYFSSASKATGVRAALARFAPAPPDK